MINTINLKVCRNIVGNFKSKIYEKSIMKKKLNQEYEKYVFNSIIEAEQSLAKGEKTYTWEEWQKMTKEWDE